ncbi:hypothetical protein GOP47_0000696 [Adiantum capillus-veneris]|uniref:Uncharacterized protein n=1 Tax=Adiantum capillus-veneris TaxID=13818 RepID=A0A9D4VE05_ADICA|nr:hypothetical protein GOP47_0000696 [Adiantum capillus-veneris]
MGSAGRSLAAGLLFLNFCMYMIVLGIAGWALNRILDGKGSDGAYEVFVEMALIAGVVGIASVLAGMHHLKAWRGESAAGAASAALIAWLLTLLAFGLACKEIHNIDGRGHRVKTLEAFVIILAFFQLLYVLVLHAGLFSSRHGPAYST